MTLTAGIWDFAATRKGISNTGFVFLSKNFPTITVSQARPEPMPEKPSISVKSNGDGSFEVTGSKFLPNKTVYIRVFDGNREIYFQATSNSQGELEGFPTGRICQLPGVLFFTANDGRSDRTDVTGTLWSNAVSISCPA